jgi:hypothetical protein
VVAEVGPVQQVDRSTILRIKQMAMQGPGGVVEEAPGIGKGAYAWGI